MTSLPNNPSVRLFIGSLPYSFTEGELLSLFVPFGRVVAVSIIQNRWGRSRGMGYVEFDTLGSAILAKEKMHRHVVEDRSIIVDYAAPDPFKTPEGQQRHEIAVEKRAARVTHHLKTAPLIPQVRRPIRDPNSPPDYTKFIKPGVTSRQSVYDSRTHLSHVGAKFAARNKKKK